MNGRSAVILTGSAIADVSPIITAVAAAASVPFSSTETKGIVQNFGGNRDGVLHVERGRVYLRQLPGI